MDFSGNSTTLSVLDSVHPSINDLNGIYNVAVDKKDTYAGIDTSFQTTLPLQMVGYDIGWDGKQYQLTPFISFYEFLNYDHSTDTRDFLRIEFSNDSVFITDEQISNFWGATKDSIVSTYVGVKQ